MVNSLAEGGWNVFLLYSNEEVAGLINESVNLIRLSVQTKVPLPFIRNLSLKDIYKVAQKLKEINLEALIVSQGDVEFGIKGLLAGRYAGLKVISYLPMAYSFNEIDARFARLRDFIDRFYYKIPDGFITTSKWQKELLSRFTSRDIKVIRNPIEISADSAICNKSFREPGKPFVRSRPVRLGIIGRIFFRHKGQDRAIKLVRDCLEAGLDYELLIIGDGPDMKAIQLLCNQAGLEQKIRLLGWKERSEVAKILVEEIDVLLIPSRFEGVPLVFLEAISLGIPLVVWRAGWIREYEIHDQLIINDSTVEEFRLAINAAMGEVGIKMIKRVRKILVKFHDPAIFRNEVNRTIAALLD